MRRFQSLVFNTLIIIYLFSSYRLEQLVEDDDLDIDVNPPLSKDKSYRKLVQCISHHAHVIESVFQEENTQKAKS